MGKIQPEPQASETARKMFKGRATWKHDLFIYWAIEMIVQVVIFYAIYSFTIESMRVKWGNAWTIRFFYEMSVYEVLYVVGLLLGSDLCAHFFAMVVVIAYDYSRGYMRNKKRKKEYARYIYEYFYYVLFRALFFMFGFIWMFTAWLYPAFQGASFLIAWILASLLIKIPAKLLALKMII